MTNNHSKKKHEGESENDDDSDGVDDDDDDDNSSENPFDSPIEPSSMYPPYPTASSFDDVYQPLPICAPPVLPPRKDLPSVPLKADDEDGDEEVSGKRGEEEEDQEPSGPTFRTYMKDKVDLLPIPSALKNFLLFYRT